jgi:undecaprenyl-phosphate 4-deoxy-4-formamido-L-arabinose transferase
MSYGIIMDHTNTSAHDLYEPISVVVPVYNSEASIRILLERLEATLQSITPHFEIILVDDGSEDASWSVISELAETRRLLRGIRLMRNYGQHNALLCGIREAKHPLLVTIDDDLQHPPEEIPKLLEKLRQGYDVIYGVPIEDHHSVWRNLASRSVKLSLEIVVGAEIARKVSAFRAFRTELRGAFTSFQAPYVSIDVLLTWGTSRFASVKVRHDHRRIGVSSYTLGKLLRHALNMTTGFSTVPLRFASIIGFAFTVFGFAILAFVVGSYFFRGSTVLGFPFLASTIAIFSGAQMFAIGVIGEYLARMHSRTMDKPVYAVRQHVGHHEEAQ